MYFMQIVEKYKFVNKMFSIKVSYISNQLVNKKKITVNLSIL